MTRRFAAILAAVVAITAALGLRELAAQPPSATASAGLPTAKVRDFEAEPPTELGTKLDVEADWESAPRPFLLRPRLMKLHRGWQDFVTMESCDLRVMNDWLKMRCKGRPGRVNQVAGDPAHAVVHISHQHARDDTGRIVEDNRRLLLFEARTGRGVDVRNQPPQ